MQKRVLPLLVFLTVILINFISAATFSLRDSLTTIDEGTLFVLSVFIISFALIFLSLSKLFKTNKPIAAIVSLVTSFLVTYWISKSDLRIENLFSDLGISEEILYVLIPLLIIVFSIFLAIQLKKKSLIVFGILLLVSSPFIEEQALVIAVGLILLVLGLLSLSKKKESPLMNLFKAFTKK